MAMIYIAVEGENDCFQGQIARLRKRIISVEYIWHKNLQFCIDLCAMVMFYKDNGKMIVFNAE